MSIDLYIEDEDGAPLGEVLDPHDLTSRIVALAGHGETACLRFVHPEGNTVFNQLQIPTLIRELQAARVHISDERLRVLTQGELESARRAKWGAAVERSIEMRSQRAGAENVKTHLRRMLELAEQARGRPHTYLKFYGD